MFRYAWEISSRNLISHETIISLLDDAVDFCRELLAEIYGSSAEIVSELHRRYGYVYVRGHKNDPLYLRLIKLS